MKSMSFICPQRLFHKFSGLEINACAGTCLVCVTQSGSYHSTPHPLKGTICKTPPTTISANTAIVVKKQKTTSPGQSKNRIRVGDFDQMTKSLTEDCIAIYSAQIGAIQPFPVKTDNLQAVELAWVEVCKN